MNLILDDTICVPGQFATLDEFRRWTRSEDYPDRGLYEFLRGEVWVDLSMETLLHNQIKSAITITIGGLVLANQLGRVFADRMRLVHEGAGISVEPDGMFVSHAAVTSKRVWFEEGAESLEVIGTPDMVLEIVSSHTVKKDTVVLRKLYAEAGISEYWLVNPLKGTVTFDILRLTAGGYVATRKSNGWVKSTVFGQSFRLTVRKTGTNLPDVRLLSR